MALPITIPIIEIYAGDTFEQSFVFQTDGVARDLVTEGWASWLAQIRVAPDSATSTAFTIDSTQANVGRITLKLTASATSTLSGAVFDLQATKGATVQTFLRGSIVIVKDVSRA
jgi:hypothetical protein